MASESVELGKTLGKLSQEQSSIKSNLSSNEQDANLVNFNQEFIRLSGEITATKKTYDTTSFILDHPTQGELDSSTLVIDGGYLDPSTDVILFTKNF